MMEVSVEQMARACKVTEKTVRDWIRHDLPVAKAGGKGPGQGAIVDLARFAAWYRRRNGDRSPHWSDGFKESYPKKNPLRDIVWNVCRDEVSLLGHVLRQWAENPTTDNADYRRDGFTKEQARAFAYKAWTVVTMAIFEYHDTRLEDRIREITGTDLDGWLSFLLEGDFRTPARALEIEFPPAMVELMPADSAEKIKTPKRKRSKSGGT